MATITCKALTFDDVLLMPGYSEVTPDMVDVKAKLTPDITLNIPLISAAMDTVTEAAMAISMARAGGIGIVHKNMPIERQALEISKVKKSESGMILDPITVHPEDTVATAMDLMQTYRVSGLPVVDERKALVGILTNRDVRFVENLEGTLVRQVMTHENLVTVSPGITLQEAKRHLHAHRIEKLLVVDENGQLAGLLTMKDIDKVQKYPSACKDSKGRLRVGAAIGVGRDSLPRAEALLAAGVDVLVLDSAHGHSLNIIKAVRAVREAFRPPRGRHPGKSHASPAGAAKKKPERKRETAAPPVPGRNSQPSTGQARPTRSYIRRIPAAYPLSAGIAGRLPHNRKPCQAPKASALHRPSPFRTPLSALPALPPAPSFSRQENAAALNGDMSRPRSPVSFRRGDF